MLTLQQRSIKVVTNPFIKTLAVFKKNSRFIISAFFPEKSLGSSEKVIIKAIHKLRFSPKNQYIITGSHFADIYTRNIGIFYNTVLDGRIFLTEDDWLDRQYGYAKTVAINLELLRQSEKAYTTFIQTGNMYVPTNIYTRPSDSLFGIFFGLSAMLDSNFVSNLYPSSRKSEHPLQTKKIAQDMLQRYSSILKKELRQYLKDVLGKDGLIKKNISLSSARDGIKRESSFYDNVIAWATVRLANDLKLAKGLPVSKQGKEYLIDWKQKIVTAFWDEKEGFFLDDLSEESKNKKVFCGDSFIVLGSLFFDLQNKDDRKKLRRIIQYVKQNNLDKPFPLSYAKKNQSKKFYWPVRIFANSYPGEAIWSHWGMEFIKAQILLSKDNPEFLEDAKKHLQAYKKNIESYGGYPELYNKKGKMFKTLFYKSVLHTSWVVNYEQAKILLEDARDEGTSLKSK